MLQCLKREPGFYRYLWGLTGPIALQNLITFTLGLMDTLMVSWLMYSVPRSSRISRSASLQASSQGSSAARSKCSRPS